MAAPERVASGAYRVDAIGLRSALSVLLIEDRRDGCTLTDTGLGSSAGRIRNALSRSGETGGLEARVSHALPVRTTSAAYRGCGSGRRTPNW
jgi:glyoxylase-like metal-dependent hydrolase (beta-lactamase superfamily II)